MTQKEIDKFLANTKVYVNGKSKEIQEKLFSLGYMWSDGSRDVGFESKPFLYISNKRLTYGENMRYFISHEGREITTEEILSIELHTYRPFKNKEECWNEMLKHKPFGWVVNTQNEKYAEITMVMNKIITFDFKDFFSYQEAFNGNTFADGIPFGIKED